MPTSAPAPRWLSPPAVGKLLGVKADGIIALIRAGRLPAVDVRRPGSSRPRFRVNPDDLDALAVRPDPLPARRRRRREAVTEFF